MSVASQRQAKALARLVEGQGFEVRRTKNGYVAYASEPSGGTAGWHRTPSDHRWFKNVISHLRKIGVEI